MINEQSTCYLTVSFSKIGERQHDQSCHVIILHQWKKGKVDQGNRRDKVNIRLFSHFSFSPFDEEKSFFDPKELFDRAKESSSSRIEEWERKTAIWPMHPGYIILNFLLMFEGSQSDKSCIVCEYRWCRCSRCSFTLSIFLAGKSIHHSSSANDVIGQQECVGMVVWSSCEKVTDSKSWNSIGWDRPRLLESQNHECKVDVSSSRTFLYFWETFWVCLLWMSCLFYFRTFQFESRICDESQRFKVSCCFLRKEIWFISHSKLMLNFSIIAIMNYSYYLSRIEYRSMEERTRHSRIAGNKSRLSFCLLPLTRIDRRRVFL